MKTIKERREEKRKEKELLKQIAEEEKRIEAEFPDSKYSISEVFAVLKNKSEEDIEYESYLTESELEEEKSRKKAEKKIMFAGIFIMVFAATFAIIYTNVYYNAHKSELLKVTEPIFKDYYKKHYGEKLKKVDLIELTREEDNETKNTGIYLLTTKDGKHLMSINNELLGDDINPSKLNNDLLTYLSTNISNPGLITHSIETSYQEYYTEYNRFLDYIHVVPNKSLDELIASKKLTVTYKLIYQHDLNDAELLDLISNFSSDSAFYLIKHEAGQPTNLKIVTHDKITSLDVQNYTKKDDDITYLELDRTKNRTTNVDVVKYAESAALAKGDYSLKNPIRIEFESEYRYDEALPSYYFLDLDNTLITEKNLVQLSTSKSDNYYQELDKDNYTDIIIIEYGSHSYLIGEEKVMIARKGEKKSFLCNLGIC